MNQELERFEPAEARGRIAYEHLHRYAICRDQVAGRRVLDVACGNGYGTNLLAQAASEATGLDLDAGAISRAKRKYRRANLKFVAADCYDMPFEDGSFDVVVANEMIEHIEDHDGFIEEAKRVLVPSGLLLVSTPNKPIYNRYKAPNEFHVSEMDIPEFRELLEHHFKHVHLLGLRMALVSAGFDLDATGQVPNLSAAKTYRGSRTEKGRPEISNDDLQLAEPEYVLAICSDSPIRLDAATSSIFFSKDDDLWLEHEKIMSWASQLHDEDETLRADLGKARSELEKAQSQLKSGGAEHLNVSARLLGRLTGSPVEAEPGAMIEAMFALNEQLIVQRAKIEALSEMQGRVGQLERELDARTGDVRRAELRVEELSRDVREVREERDRLSSEFKDEQDRAEKLRRELEDAQAEFARLQDEHDRAREERERLASELEAERTAKERLERESKRLKSDLDAARGGSAKAGGHGKTGTPKDQRRQARLVSSQRLVHEQLDRSHGAIRNAIPRAAPKRRSLRDRVTGAQPSHRSMPFDRGWVERQVPGANGITISQFLSNPKYHRIDPHPLFAAAYYLDRNPDVAAAGLAPLEHYMEHGWREGRDPHPWFANDFYLSQNRDVLEAGLNPLAHYLEHGWKESRRPNPIFDPAAYLSRHKDVAESGIEPLTHFVAFGQYEDREPPFMGLEKEWRSLVGDTKAHSLMEYLLSQQETTRTVVPGPVSDRDDGRWPPAALSDFWLPQALRDYLVEKQWQDQIPLFTYFYSVMDAYADSPDEFASSNTCRRLVDRARELSSSRDGAAATASVIVPVYNNLLDTLLCIVALLETDPKAPFEIIVADDGSTDETARIIPEIGGVVRHLRQPKNLGFLGNCNVAAEQARGQTIVLLNNDTLALPGWLDGLLAPFDRLEKVGLVGSKLINWDGRLQEAGGIFWKDGSAWNFGRGQNPLDPEFNYLKDVDYCSGAAIAIPTELWRDLGGFDPSYAPAYCEDSDMAFRIRDRGLRTLYSPESEIIHHEGRSHGKDTGVGIKAYQVTNQERLVRRWHDELERDHFQNGTDVLRARDRSIGKPHILVIDHYIPQPDRDAGSRTMFHFLEALIDSGWAVTFWPENLHHDLPYARMVQEIGVEVIYGAKYVGKFADFLRERKGLYDAVLLSRPHVAVHFIDDVRALTDARILYYGHDVHFERMRAQRQVNESTIDEQAVEAMKALELGLCDKCNVVLYPSEEEARLLRKLVSRKVQARAIPAYRFDDGELGEAERAVAQRRPRPEDKPARLLFVGGFSHGPNVDGVTWFCREIAPILRNEGFRFDLDIAGSNPTSDVWDLERDDTHVLGFVSDERLAELYRDADIVIAPLRFGAGVKGKVVEAMARGAPIVTTDVGAQGLARPEGYLFLGNNAEEFAAAVRAAADPNAAKAKARSALDYVRAHYSRTAMIDVFRQVLPSVASVRQAA